jgi:hypothetical protein
MEQDAGKLVGAGIALDPRYRHNKIALMSGKSGLAPRKKKLAHRVGSK